MTTIFELKQCAKALPLDERTHTQYLCHILNKSWTFLLTHDDYVLSDDEYQRYQAGFARLEYEPLAYVIGTQGFWGHEFLVNEHTLIPRPDSEILVQVALDFVHDKGWQTGKILDLGTGSGCLAISLAKELPNFLVMGVDKSAQAISTASQNAHRLHADNITLVLSDWFSSVAGLWQVIVANPPYIAPDDEHLTDLTAEPITALVADKDGLADIEHIIAHAPDFLDKGGLLAIEHGYNQAKAVSKLFAHAGYQDIKTHQDYGNNDRITCGVWYAH